MRRTSAKYTAGCCIMASAAIVLFIASVGFANDRLKPQYPVQISIAPVSYSPGDTGRDAGSHVEMRVTARSLARAKEMRILSTLGEGVHLVSGILSWSGPADKGEERSLVFTVRTTKRGAGKIFSTVEVDSADGIHFTVSAEYDLGAKTDEKPASPRAVGKDRKGRVVEEYR